MTPMEFLARIRSVAVGIPGINAEGTAAHAALESAFGTSGLAANHGNLFGLKRGSTWTGETVSLPTWEVVNGQRVETTAEFRVYPSWVESVEDYAATINRIYPWAVRFASHPVAFLAGVYNVGNYRWATDPDALAKAVRLLDQYGLLTARPEQERLGRHELVVDNSPSLSAAWETAVASLQSRAAVHRMPVNVTRTRRPDGSYKLDTRAV